ncbi:hypothetical protein I4U23_005752 [Adineta vaga]|nr:hypothetical protein I4U23_005752 [Adineta vaga]
MTEVESSSSAFVEMEEYDDDQKNSYPSTVSECQTTNKQIPHKITNQSIIKVVSSGDYRSDVERFDKPRERCTLKDYAKRKTNENIEIHKNNTFPTVPTKKKNNLSKTKHLLRNESNDIEISFECLDSTPSINNVETAENIENERRHLKLQILQSIALFSTSNAREDDQSETENEDQPTTGNEVEQNENEIFSSFNISNDPIEEVQNLTSGAAASGNTQAQPRHRPIPLSEYMLSKKQQAFANRRLNLPRSQFSSCRGRTESPHTTEISADMNNRETSMTAEDREVGRHIPLVIEQSNPFQQVRRSMESTNPQPSINPVDRHIAQQQPLEQQNIVDKVLRLFFGDRSESDIAPNLDSEQDE